MPLFFFVAALALVADQLSKIAVRRSLEPGDHFDVVSGWLHFGHVHNYGAAWGVLSGQRWLLVVFTLIVSAAIVWSAREMVERGKLATIGLGLILGGAVGNLIDRVLQGYVTDFIDLDTPVEVLRTFPVFNIADSALTVGVILMLLSLLFARPEGQKS